MSNTFYVTIAGVLLMLGGAAGGVVFQRMTGIADKHPLLIVATIFLAMIGMEMLWRRFLPRPQRSR